MQAKATDFKLYAECFGALEKLHATMFTVKALLEDHCHVFLVQHSRKSNKKPVQLCIDQLRNNFLRF